MNLRLLLTAALLTPVPALADPLTFDAALERASREAPSLAASAAGVEAKRSAAIAAGQLPDPTLSVGIENFPVSGPPAFTFNRDSQTMARVGIEQAFPNPAKRRAQRGRAQADIGVAEADLAVEAQNVRLKTALAWVDLYYAKRRLAQLERLDESLGDLQATVSARLASGSARPSQALEPEQLREIGRVERTLFMLDWLESPSLRRRCQAGLNKSEQRHFLTQAICTFKQGRIADRTHEAQQFRASGLNLIIAAIVYWNSTYIADAVAHIRASGELCPTSFWRTHRLSGGATSHSRATSSGTAPLRWHPGADRSTSGERASRHETQECSRYVYV